MIEHQTADLRFGPSGARRPRGLGSIVTANRDRGGELEPNIETDVLVEQEWRRLRIQLRRFGAPTGLLPPHKGVHVARRRVDLTRSVALFL
jgi:hypothetical protein